MPLLLRGGGALSLAPRRRRAPISGDYWFLPKIAARSTYCGLFFFLKVYNTEIVLAAMCGVDEKAYRNRGWAIIRSIASLKNVRLGSLSLFFLALIFTNLYVD